MEILIILSEVGSAALFTTIVIAEYNYKFIITSKFLIDTASKTNAESNLLDCAYHKVRMMMA